MMDGESCDFARQIVAVLKEAGCTVPNLTTTAVNDSPGYVFVSKNGQSSDEVASMTVSALMNVGISDRREDIPTNLMGGPQRLKVKTWLCLV
jgi:predicted ABC-type transport system involved in lysophospholipase L1 biosynthesis ATPase subunit